MKIAHWMFSVLFLFFLPVATTLAQAGGSSVEMADSLRQEGKIYVVVVSVFVIVAGLVLFLIRLDGRLSKLERENQTKP